MPLVSCGHCDRMQQALAHDGHGRSVVSTFAACTIIGTSTEQTIELVLPSGRRETIFKFVPNGGVVAYKGVKVPGPFGPEAVWVSPNILEISIGAVAAILEKHDQVEDVHITYKIGMVLAG